jgi:hypothetical protein
LLKYPVNPRSAISRGSSSTTPSACRHPGDWPATGSHGFSASRAAWSTRLTHFSEAAPIAAGAEFPSTAIPGPADGPGTAGAVSADGGVPARRSNTRRALHSAAPLETP